MAKIHLQFELADEQEQEPILQEIETQFESLKTENAKEIEAVTTTTGPDRAITGLELVAVIGVGILIFKESDKLIDAIFNTAIKVVQKYHELIKEIRVGIGPDMIPLSQLTEAQKQQILREAADEEDE